MGSLRGSTLIRASSLPSETRTTRTAVNLDAFALPLAHVRDEPLTIRREKRVDEVALHVHERGRRVDQRSVS